MSGTEQELEQLRDDLDELATTMQPPPMPDATAVHSRWRRRRRRSRVVMVCAAVATIGIGITALLTAPWDGPEQSTIVSGPDASSSLSPSPLPTPSRDPDVDTFDYDGACPDDSRRAGSCPVGRRGQEEWKRLVAAFDESIRISPRQIACDHNLRSAAGTGSWGCSFFAYLGDEAYDPRIILDDGTLAEDGLPEVTEAMWPQIGFFLDIPAQPGETAPKVRCRRGGLVPFDKCNPDEGAAFNVTRGDGATAIGKFWAIPRDSSLGHSIVAALERWAEDY